MELKPLDPTCKAKKGITCDDPTDTECVPQDAVECKPLDPPCESMTDIN